MSKKTSFIIVCLGLLGVCAATLKLSKPLAQPPITHPNSQPPITHPSSQPPQKPLIQVSIGHPGSQPPPKPLIQPLIDYPGSQPPQKPPKKSHGRKRRQVFDDSLASNPAGSADARVELTKPHLRTI